MVSVDTEHMMMMMMMMAIFIVYGANDLSTAVSLLAHLLNKKLALMPSRLKV